MDYDTVNKRTRDIVWWALVAVAWVVYTGAFKLLSGRGVSWVVVLASLWVPAVLGAMVVLLIAVLDCLRLVGRALKRLFKRNPHPAAPPADRPVAGRGTKCKHDREFHVTAPDSGSNRYIATLYCATCGLQLRRSALVREFDAHALTAPHPYYWRLVLEDLRGYSPLADQAVQQRIDRLYDPWGGQSS